MKKTTDEIVIGDTIIIDGAEVFIDQQIIIEEDSVIIDGFFVDTGESYTQTFGIEEEVVYVK